MPHGAGGVVQPREHRLLKNIERVTRQRIEIAKIPTVADLRARVVRFEPTRSTRVTGQSASGASPASRRPSRCGR